MALEDVLKRLRETNRTGGSALEEVMTRPAGPGIDFMAATRGYRAAKEARAEDAARESSLERLDALMSRVRDAREATTYLSTLMSNMQEATDAGVSPADFLIQQRQQILADPAFQSKTPEVQSNILDSLSKAALIRGRQLYRTGDTQSAARLLDSYGLVGPGRRFDTYLNSPMEAINAAGLEVDEDGMVTVNNTKIPAGLAAFRLIQRGNMTGLLPEVLNARRRQEALQFNKRLFGDAAGAAGTAGTAGGTNPLIPDPNEPVGDFAPVQGSERSWWEAFMEGDPTDPDDTLPNALTSAFLEIDRRMGGLGDEPSVEGISKEIGKLFGFDNKVDRNVLNRPGGNWGLGDLNRTRDQ